MKDYHQEVCNILSIINEIQTEQNKPTGIVILLDERIFSSMQVLELLKVCIISFTRNEYFIIHTEIKRVSRQIMCM